MPISTQGLVKAAQTLCPHVIVNRGCSIYETRPNVCRTWHCLWRRDAQMPDELRPDRSGIIFALVVYDEERSLFERAHITCIAMHSKSAHAMPLVASTITRYIEDGMLPVWLGHGGGKTLAWPDTELADAICHPITTRFAHRVAQGKAWRARYESLIEDLQVENARFDNQFVKR